ncbi:MAG: hypothetical protein ACTIJ9_11375 [Aequorivita sp.]
MADVKVRFGEYKAIERDLLSYFYPYLLLDKVLCDALIYEEVNLHPYLLDKYKKHKVAKIYFAKNEEITLKFNVVRGGEDSFNDDGNIYFELSKEAEFKIEQNEFEVKYGSQINLKIKNQKISKKVIFIDIFSDDWMTSKLKCGRIALISNLLEKDVFTSEENKRLVDEIKYIAPHADLEIAPEYDENYCMQAAERGLSELLNNEINFYAVKRGSHIHKNSLGFSGLNAIDRGTKFNSLGFVKSTFIFDDYKIDQTKRKSIIDVNTYNSLKYDIVSISNGKKILIDNYFDNTKDGIGYHVYYLSVTNGFHVLLLVVNNSNPCDPIYTIYDQHGITSSSGKLNDIAEGILRQTNWTFANTCLNRHLLGKSSQWDSTKTYLWKIQKK